MRQIHLKISMKEQSISHNFCSLCFCLYFFFWLVYLVICLVLKIWLEIVENLFWEMWAWSRTTVFDFFRYSLAHGKLWRFMYNSFILAIICSRARESYALRLQCFLPSDQCVSGRRSNMSFFTRSQHCRYRILVRSFNYLFVFKSRSIYMVSGWVS